MESVLSGRCVVKLVQYYRFAVNGLPNQYVSRAYVVPQHSHEASEVEGSIAARVTLVQGHHNVHSILVHWIEEQLEEHYKSHATLRSELYRSVDVKDESFDVSVHVLIIQIEGGDVRGYEGMP